MAEDLELARIEIVRVFTADGEDLIWSTTHTEDGEMLPLVEALGMLRMAEDTIIREHMGEADG
jgi:hypothetical protein